MTITVTSVVEDDHIVRARARATAQDARIMIEVSFAPELRPSREDLWHQARDEVLRYLYLTQLSAFTRSSRSETRPECLLSVDAVHQLVQLPDNPLKFYWWLS